MEPSSFTGTRRKKGNNQIDIFKASINEVTFKKKVSYEK